MNPAAQRMFPGLHEAQFDHAFFEEIKNRLGTQKEFKCHAEINGHIFDQKIYFIPDTTIIRIYANDITERIENERNLARLASM